MSSADDEKVQLSSPDPEVIPIVLEFVNSTTYEEKEKLIRRNPKLLEKCSDDVLLQIEDIWRQRGDENAVMSISAWRDYLGYVKEFDFEMARLIGAVYRAFYYMPDEYAGEYLDNLTRTQPELLNPRADEAFLYVKSQFIQKGGEDDFGALFIDEIRKRVSEQRDRKKPIIEKTEASLDRSKIRRSVSKLFR